MAQKRMFDKAIIDMDKFMDLPISGKALYFLLGMEADDEGFVSYKKVIRIHGGTDDDIKILTAKGFVLMFKSGVVVITDWNRNNYLDKNRIRETEYQNERKLLSLTSKGKYVFNNGLTSIEENRIEQNSIEENRIDTASEQNSQITEIMSIFQKINPTINYGNKTQRNAVVNLIKKIGFEKTKGSALYAVSVQGQPYTPTITTPYQLHEKLAALVAYNSKEKNKNNINIINLNI